MARHGYIRDKLDIKFLVLYILKQIRDPIPFAELGEISMCDEAMDYFEFADAAMGLIETGHMQEEELDGVKRYSITEKGRKTAEICESSLPYTVKVAAQRAVLSVVARMQREASIHTETIEKDGNLYVRCSLEDPYCTIMSLDLMVVTRQQANMLERNFKENAEKIYNVVLDAMLRDYRKEEEELLIQEDGEPEDEQLY